MTIGRGYPDGWFRMLEFIAANREQISGTEMMLVHNLRYWRGRPTQEAEDRVRNLYTSLIGGEDV